MAGPGSVGEGETSQLQPDNPSTSSSTTAGAAANNKRVRARPDPLLVTCRCFSFVTVIAAILCIVVNVFSAVRSFRNGLDVFDGIFRCYAVLISLFVIVAETEWGFIIKFWKVLEYWAGRGMLQILYVQFFYALFFLVFGVTSNLHSSWIGVAVMTRAYPDIYGERQELLLLRNIASYALLACGLIYVISGALCLGVLKRARQKKEVSTEQAIKDLQDLERRRAELEALLIVENP